MSSVDKVTTATPAEIKQLIVDSLHLEGTAPESFADDAPLFGPGEGGLGLDSVDALELVVAIEKKYGIKVQSQEVGREAFSSAATLAAFVRSRLTT